MSCDANRSPCCNANGSVGCNVNCNTSCKVGCNVKGEVSCKVSCNRSCNRSRHTDSGINGAAPPPQPPPHLQWGGPGGEGGGGGGVGGPALSTAGGSEALRGIFGIAVIGRRPPALGAFVSPLFLPHPPQIYFAPPPHRYPNREKKRREKKKNKKAQWMPAGEAPIRTAYRAWAPPPPPGVHSRDTHSHRTRPLPGGGYWGGGGGLSFILLFYGVFFSPLFVLFLF